MILEQLREGLVIATGNPTRVLFVNPAMTRITGYDQDELLGATYDQIAAWIHPEDRAAFLERWEKRLAGEEVPERFELRTIRKDGSEAWLAASSALIQCDGEPATLTILRDITERVMAKVALQEVEERLRAFFNASTEPALLVDTECTILATNEALAKRFGKRVYELIGTNTSNLFPLHVAKRRKAYADEVIHSGKSLHFEDEREGRRICHSLYPVFDNDGNVIQVAIYARDITEERKAEKALKQSETALRRRTHELEEANTALRVLLKQRTEDRAHVEHAVSVNIKDVTKPFIERLKATPLNDQQRAYLQIAESNLNHIVSPFAHKLAEKYSLLTPAEIQTAYLVREGKT
ncbi:MAG: PAS domain S-box protein, partial [Thermodesulfobacteriota bacterium]|nr:PAS domain S-box protein [Thermodesulfobacteriota bacterium]